MRQTPPPFVLPSTMRFAKLAVAALLLQAATIAGAHGAETSHLPEAPAGENPADLFHKGLAEYDARNYGPAIDIFARVYDQTHAPALLFNIAQARRLQGDCPKAVSTYEAFVVADPSSPDIERARGWLEKLRPCQRAVVALEPREVADTKSEPAPAPAAPSISLRPAAPPPAAPAAPRNRALVVGALGGAAIVLAGAGTYAAWRAHDVSRQVSVSYGNGGTWNSQAAALDAEGKHLQSEAIAFGTAAVLSGLAAYLVHRLSSPHPDNR